MQPINEFMARGPSSDLAHLAAGAVRSSMMPRTPGGEALSDRLPLCRLMSMGARRRRRISDATARVLQLFLDDSNNPRYGLQILKTSRIPSGSLYPILIRLEEQEIIGSRWESATASSLGRPRRRLYELTPAGRSTARGLIEDWAAAKPTGVPLKRHRHAKPKPATP